MNREDIIRMAQEAISLKMEDHVWTMSTTHLQRFATLVAAAERQQIAAEFEKRHEGIKHLNNYWLHAANYVKERGNT